MRIDKFLEIPTQEQWEAELEDGWDGPDGSSLSTDHMMGIRIGETSPDYKYHRLPANLHDWRYHLGRKYGLHGHHRHAADVAYREDCIDYITRRLDGRTMETIGIIRAWVRYYALRVFGRAAWKG
jgi:hypothetical protein